MAAISPGRRDRALRVGLGWTVRVWDLATGTLVGDPATGHSDWIRPLAVGEVDGRPVVVSGSDDQTVWVWDLATGTPVGDPLTGHSGPVYALAVGEVEGRPVVVSGSSDWMAWVWDLATGTPVGDPFASHNGPVALETIGIRKGRWPVPSPAHIGVGTRSIVAFAEIRVQEPQKICWRQIAAPDIRSDVLALALARTRILIAGTESGIVTLESP